jgi:hypothetical protein
VPGSGAIACFGVQQFGAIASFGVLQSEFHTNLVVFGKFLSWLNSITLIFRHLLNRYNRITILDVSQNVLTFY